MDRVFAYPDSRIYVMFYRLSAELVDSLDLTVTCRLGYAPWNQHSTWKWMVGRLWLVSFWDGLFWGAMLALLGSVTKACSYCRWVLSLSWLLFLVVVMVVVVVLVVLPGLGPRPLSKERWIQTCYRWSFRWVGFGGNVQELLEHLENWGIDQKSWIFN